MDLPQSYIIDKFYSVSFNVKETSKYLNGCCPVCNEGESWGKKTRLFYFKNEDFLYCHNCFAGDVKILTLEYGAIEFNKIVGQYVTIKCKDGEWRKRIIQSYGKRPVFEYGFSNISNSIIKYTIKATENHKWFIKRDKKRRKYDYTTSLKINDRLDSVQHIDNYSLEGIIHGIIFGDGTYRKYKGEKRYAVIRVCKQDSRRQEILSLLSKAGYIIHYPPNLKGDAYVNIGNKTGLKDVPDTLDPSYISGFIYGLWLTDGHKKLKYSIHTIRKDLVDWMIKYSAIGGFRISNVSKPIIRKNCYPNASPIYNIVLKKNSDIILRKKTYSGIEEVFCLEETETGGFYLDNNILTGNCSRGWTPFFWVKDACGLTFKEIKKELEGYSFDFRYKSITDQQDEKIFDLPALPGECVNLRDSLQLKYYSKYKVVTLAREYCEERRLFTAINSPKTFYCCLNDKFHGNRLIIPYFDDKGKVECYSSRKLLESDTKAKYLLKFGSKKPVFNLSKVDENFPYIFLFEGQIDCMFVKNGVAVSGTKLTKEQEHAITSQYPFHKIIWVLDNFRFENKEVIKIIKDKMIKNEHVFLYDGDFSPFKDLNLYCIKKEQDFIDPALLINGSYSGEKNLIRLGD